MPHTHIRRVQRILCPIPKCHSREWPYTYHITHRMFSTIFHNKTERNTNTCRYSLSRLFIMVKKPISSQGRRKIEMAKIPNQSNLQVTFSKRRSGLFKKARELCTLCGVEIAIVVFSPASKPFSFGHPAVDFVIDRFFISQKISSVKYPFSDNNNNQAIFEPNFSSKRVIIHELYVKLTQLVSELEAERKNGQVFYDQGYGRSQCWWESPVDELSLSELELFKASLEELKNKVNLTRQAHKNTSDHQISTFRFPIF